MIWLPTVPNDNGANRGQESQSNIMNEDTTHVRVTKKSAEMLKKAAKHQGVSVITLVGRLATEELRMTLKKAYHDSEQEYNSFEEEIQEGDGKK